MIHVERATEEHALAIAPRLSIFGCPPHMRDPQMVLAHVRSSVEAWTWLEGERPLAMAGVQMTSFVGGAAVPWLLTTPEAFAHPRVFWRASKAMVAYLRHEYERLQGVVDGDFIASQRWLKRLGFHIVEAPFDFEGRRVLPIFMER